MLAANDRATKLSKYYMWMTYDCNLPLSTCYPIASSIDCWIWPIFVKVVMLNYKIHCPYVLYEFSSLGDIHNITCLWPMLFMEGFSFSKIEWLTPVTLLRNVVQETLDVRLESSKRIRMTGSNDVWRRLLLEASTVRGKWLYWTFRHFRPKSVRRSLPFMVR